MLVGKSLRSLGSFSLGDQEGNCLMQLVLDNELNFYLGFASSLNLPYRKHMEIRRTPVFVVNKCFYPAAHCSQPGRPQPQPKQKTPLNQNNCSC